MFNIYKLHKYSGIFAGVFLFILAFTGFFLNHDNWRFLYNITFTHVPKSTLDLQYKSYESYWIDEKNTSHILLGGHRGLFESYNAGKSYRKVLNRAVFAIRKYKKSLFLATDSGIYLRANNNVLFKSILLSGKIVNSLNIYKNFLIVAIDKRKIALYDLRKKKLLKEETIQIDKRLLNENITLSRLVRDLHYGRGLFDDISLLINDFAAIILIILSVSGYIIWILLKNVYRIKNNKSLIKNIIKSHSNSISILALFPLLILLITGILLDHANGLNKVMKSISIKNIYLPPVYHSLKYDIWGVDYDGKYFFIGNRYGVYRSKNLENFNMVSKGFVYRLIRKNNILYVSGMGSPNRIYKNNKWEVLYNTPHMFKDVVSINKKIFYMSTCGKCQIRFSFPRFKEATLYEVFLSMHDGSFFSSWWIWINDLASILLLILGITGFWRWWKIKKYFKKLFS